MPLYDFVCKNEKCRHEFEESVPLTEFDTRVVKCPKCEEEAKRQLVVLKGAHTTWKHWRT